MDSLQHYGLWLILGWFVIKALMWRSGANKGLILKLLLQHGPLTGRELRTKGVGGSVYGYLLRLEQEGLVDRLDDPQPPPESGLLPIYRYRIAEILRV